MKNLLVTGGCGFIGSNFIKYLFESIGFTGRIINVDKLTYAGNPENLKSVEINFKDRYHFVKADICDYRAMESVFNTYSPDVICHLAAESHVDRSIIDPESFAKTNILGTLTLLELVRKNKSSIRLFYHVSTDEVYGSAPGCKSFTEEDSYNPGSPYSASKASADHLVRAYHKTYGVPIIVSNCTNNYGPYQFPEKLIPLVIVNAVEGKSIPVYGDGLNVRDWLYVRDHCSAMYTIINKGVIGETYNISSGHERANITIIQSICSVVDSFLNRNPAASSINLLTFVKDRPGHDFRYSISSEKIRKTLFWKPIEGFYSGIQNTVEWYLNNEEWITRIKNGEYKNWISEQYPSL